MRESHYMRMLFILFLFLLLAACGGSGGGGSDDNDDNPGISEPNVSGTEIDMWAGGVASSADGVTVEALEGSWEGTVEVVFEPTETTNDPVEDGFPASDVYGIRLLGFETGETTVPFKVTVPVTTTDLPTPIDKYAFAVETYNEDTGQWERNDAMAQYDENTNSVTFWSNHFSKKRVVYMGPDLVSKLNKVVYKSAHDKFYITYFSPVIFNNSKQSNYLPPADNEWQGSGTATDPEVPDYIEDLGKALETALTYHTTKIIQPNGYLLFDDPTPSLENHAISVTVTKIPTAHGDTRLGGPVRIDTGLKNWHQMKVVAGHELIHVLADQHYTMIGAAENRWFFEAIAELYGTRAAGYSKAERTTYFSTYDNYLKVSLDASDEESYYGVGDFLYWLEDKMKGNVAAGVVALDYARDRTGLNNLLKEWGSTLGDEYTQYVLECTVGDYDHRADNIIKTIILNTTAKSPLLQAIRFNQPHLSATHVTVFPYLSVDGMLVAESGALQGGDIPLKTYSYTDEKIPVADIDNNLEKTAVANKPIVVKHFGKKGAFGVEKSVFHQIIINPLIDNSGIVNGKKFYFDYYMLVPPETTLQFDGKVTWTFPNTTTYGGEHYPIKGFNVYSDGVQLTNSPINYTLREYSDVRILSNSDVQVTVVDKYDNEWPEVEEGEQPPNWEMRMTLTGTFDDYKKYYPAVVSEWFQKWIPVTVSQDGAVNFDYNLESDFGGSGQIEDKPNHIWGTGTFKDDKLIINGHWATKQTIVVYKGEINERSDVLNVDGEFTLAGHFTSGFFFSDSDENHATANARQVSTWTDPDYSAPETHTGTNMTPDMYIDDFRAKQ